MKTLSLVATIAASLFCVSALHAQTTVTTRKADGRKVTTTITARRSVYQSNAVRNAPVVIGPRTDGSIPRAIRSGNPLQMINPAAPAEYGDGRDVTYHNVDDPFQRPRGLKLYAISF